MSVTGQSESGRSTARSFEDACDRITDTSNMDDIFMISPNTKDGTPSNAFIKDFERSECYFPPLNLSTYTVLQEDAQHAAVVRWALEVPKEAAESAQRARSIAVIKTE